MNYSSEDYYQILGVDRQATALDIENAFALLRVENLLSGDDPGMQSEYEHVQHAYAVLSDPQRRSFYDSLLVDTAVAPFQLQVQSSSTRISVLDTTQIVYLLVNVKPNDAPNKHMLPLNLCLVIDCSTSMRGERLAQVRKAVQLVLNKLAPSDVISVISFSDRASVVVPAGYLNEQEDALERIDSLVASGGTEIYQGLAAGVQQMRQVALDDYTNHLILLTDGHTYGDTQECLQLATDIADENIKITAFGIGADWNDLFLDSLVAPSQGQSGYIEKPATIVDFLEERIDGLGVIYARNVRLRSQWPGRVSLQNAFKLTPVAQPLALGTAEIDLGDIEGRVPLSFLLTLSLAPQPILTRIKISLTLTADLPDKLTQTLKEQVQFMVMHDAPKVEPPPALIRAVRMQTLYQLNEKALQEAEEGQLGVAAQRLRHLTTRYLEAGEPQLAKQAGTEAERLARMETLSPEGRKRLKYGTRMLIGQTVVFDGDDSL